jgi:hypothetical protein
MPTIWQNYRKDKTHPPGHGYGYRTGMAWQANRPGQVISLVVHSTNGNKGSSLTAEAKFLRDSPNVSTHYLIGKDGTIVESLPPEACAWHAGSSLAEFHNYSSIGVELHHAVGDDYPQPQFESLTWLVEQCISAYDLHPEAIETHRKIALPKGRKVDPSDWSDAGFYAWRKELFQPDWAGMWGDEFPYIPEHGIPTKWREMHGQFGKAMTPEHSFAGRVIQWFERGALVYRDGHGVKSYPGEF